MNNRYPQKQTILSSTRQADHHHVKPVYEGAGQYANRVFERYGESGLSVAAGRSDVRAGLVSVASAVDLADDVIGFGSSACIFVAGRQFSRLTSQLCGLARLSEGKGSGRLTEKRLGDTPGIV
jgi:hypothetical protein